MNRVEVDKKVLSENDRIAARLRDALDGIGTLSLNFIGSPGAGKTALLERTLERLPHHTRAAVVTGDIQTENDAIRLRRYGYPVRQITTAGACHLDARMVEKHVTDWLEARLESPVHRKRRQPGLSHQLRPGRRRQDRGAERRRRRGQAAQVSGHLSQGGADDPEQDRSASACSVPTRIAHARTRVASIPRSKFIETSCTTGAGFDQWLKWLAARAERKNASAKHVAEAVS